MNLYENAKKLHSGDSSTKPLGYYEFFEAFLKNHSVTPTTILEIGTHRGESAKVFAKTFPDAIVVSVDKFDCKIDCSSYSNLHFIQADQANAAQLQSVIKKYFPNGIDMVVEDASHIGFLSKITFETIFPSLRSGGAYFIEDWGTGYWDTWVDGSRFQRFPVFYHSGNIPSRLPSHDFGMVGFVKSLVDWTHESAIRNRLDDETQSSSRISALEFREGVCMVLKS